MLVMLTALGHPGIPLLTHAVAQMFGIGNGSQAALNFFKAGVTGLVVLNGEGALLGENLSGVFRG